MEEKSNRPETDKEPQIPSAGDLMAGPDLGVDLKMLQPALDVRKKVSTPSCGWLPRWGQVTRGQACVISDSFPSPHGFLLAPLLHAVVRPSAPACLGMGPILATDGAQGLNQGVTEQVAGLGASETPHSLHTAKVQIPGEACYPETEPCQDTGVRTAGPRQRNPALLKTATGSD